uniref:Uncharacterized protein n=1 Tax=Anopheles atroparvus TaxID=41427 RepID=A0AAG5CVV4_ANOAO
RSRADRRRKRNRPIRWSCCTCIHSWGPAIALERARFSQIGYIVVAQQQHGQYLLRCRRCYSSPGKPIARLSVREVGHAKLPKGRKRHAGATGAADWSGERPRKGQNR